MLTALRLSLVRVRKRIDALLPATALRLFQEPSAPFGAHELIAQSYEKP